MRNILVSIGVAVFAVVALAAGQGSQAANESLWEAARAGDTTRITAALGQGADRSVISAASDSSLRS